MPTTYTSLGHLILSNVSFTGNEGDPGSTLSWDGFLRSNSDLDVIDQDDDGNLDATGATPDEFVNESTAGTEVFTGYTITSGGTEYGVFSNGFTYYVPLPVNGIGQGIIADSGTSNVYQAEATGAVFLCFAEGTQIATPFGEVAVERLLPGEGVLAADGRVVPVRWVGRRTIRRREAAAVLVRIAAGVLGNRSALTVTADHGMIVDGYVIAAAALVGAPGVDWVPVAQLPEEFTVYHVETEAHEAILANGAASETFIDAAGRAAFDNHAEYLSRHRVEGIIPEMRLPRIASQRLLPEELRARFGFASNERDTVRVA